MVSCEVAKKADMKKVYVFSLGSVLSGFGSSVADISHTYEYSPIVPAADRKSLANIVQWMVDEARRDMEGEGLDLSKVEAELELSLYNQKDPENLIQISCPWAMSTTADKAPINMLDDCLKTSKLGSIPADVVVEILRLRTKTPISKIQPPEFEGTSEDPQSAFKEEREILQGEGKVTTKIYEWDKLQTDNVIVGPAIIEGTDTTYIVPRGWQFVMDSFRNGVLERRK